MAVQETTENINIVLEQDSGPIEYNISNIPIDTVILSYSYTDHQIEYDETETFKYREPSSKDIYAGDEARRLGIPYSISYDGGKKFTFDGRLDVETIPDLTINTVTYSYDLSQVYGFRQDNTKVEVVKKDRTPVFPSQKIEIERTVGTSGKICTYDHYVFNSDGYLILSFHNGYSDNVCFCTDFGLSLLDGNEGSYSLNLNDLIQYAWGVEVTHPSAGETEYHYFNTEVPQNTSVFVKKGMILNGTAMFPTQGSLTRFHVYFMPLELV